MSQYDHEKSGGPVRPVDGSHFEEYGMSLLDHFAGQTAMLLIKARFDKVINVPNARIAEMAYEMAELLIAERNKRAQ